MRRRLRARETAGVILFGATNGGDAAHWRRLTRSVQQAGHGRALIMVDQEGGDIRTVEHVGPEAGQPFQGAPASGPTCSTVRMSPPSWSTMMRALP